MPAPYPIPAPHSIPAASLLVVAVLVVFYVLPSLIAIARGVRGVVRLNVFTGWTGIGWVIALALACRTRHVSPPWR